MKKVLLIILSIFTFQNFLNSQSCLPEGITFLSQAQVDSFPINYPGCSEIEGFVTIGPANSWDEIDIANLDSLIYIHSIVGYLKVYNNDIISDLTGLDSLQSIDGDLLIETNSSVESLNGLEGLTTVGGILSIYSSNYLTSLSGLENLTSVGGNLKIEYNNALADITSLEGVFSINGELKIFSNATLSSLEGLNSIDAESISNLSITNNPLLSYCEVESVCNYLSVGTGATSISSNVSGCNNVTQVNAACLVIGVKEVFDNDEFTLFPNPAKNEIFISTSKEIRSIRIYNQLGQQVFYSDKYEESIDVTSLLSGIYLMVIKTDKSILQEKILIQ